MDVKFLGEVPGHVGAAVVVPVVLGYVVHVVEYHAVVRTKVLVYELEPSVEQHRPVEGQFPSLLKYKRFYGVFVIGFLIGGALRLFWL